jgi:hypothetical protein
LQLILCGGNRCEQHSFLVKDRGSGSPSMIGMSVLIIEIILLCI